MCVLESQVFTVEESQLLPNVRAVIIMSTSTYATLGANFMNKILKKNSLLSTFKILYIMMQDGVPSMEGANVCSNSWMLLLN